MGTLHRDFVMRFTNQSRSVVLLAIMCLARWRMHRVLPESLWCEIYGRRGSRWSWAVDWPSALLPRPFCVQTAQMDCLRCAPTPASAHCLVAWCVFISCILVWNCVVRFEQLKANPQHMIKRNINIRVHFFPVYLSYIAIHFFVLGDIHYKHLKKISALKNEI